MIRHHTITYAQNREDIILAGFFDNEERGFYVDVGAYDPEYDSVTKYFYEREWHGINIEPQPDRLELFIKKRPLDTNINMGISDKEGTLQLRSYKNQGLSTFSTNMKKSYEGTHDTDVEEYKDIPVKVTTLSRLFEKHKTQNIQFMKVDVEGLEYEVLNGNDWKKYRPEVICIEANHIQRDWGKLLRENDYSLTFFDGLNEYYTDNQTDRSSKFDYVKAVAFREPIVHHMLLDDFNKYDKAVAWLEGEIKKLQVELEASQEHAQTLQAMLDEVTPLRRHLKRHIRYRLKQVDQRITNTLEGNNNFSPKTFSDKSGTKGDAILQSAQADDAENFAAYNMPRKPRRTLSIYKASKEAGLAGFAKVKKKRNKKDDEA